MGRTRDGGLAAGLLVFVSVLAIGVGASIEVRWLFTGIATTFVFETLAYRRPTVVREQFERRAVLLGSLLLVAVAIGAGAIVAPDQVLSLAMGALGTYLSLLAAVAVTGLSPGNPT